MAGLQPIYSAENSRAAYQLNWSLTVFLRQPIPSKSEWLDELSLATEKDAIRILEFCQLDDLKLQFLISTQPQLAPSQILRSVKGRLQHLIQQAVPKAFQRNYGIYSVGEANHACLNGYVAKQTSRHPMADVRIQQRLESCQFFDESVNLVQPRLSSHGQYLHNLHLIFENRDHLHDVADATLQGMRSMIIRCSIKKQHLLARIGLVSNHVHLLLG